MTEPLELHDMQRLVLEGYDELCESRYALLRVRAGAEAVARRWLNAAIPRVGNSAERRDGSDPRLAIAFTAPGLAAFGLEERDGFLAPFLEGMNTENRAKTLGDSWKQWRWGVHDPAPHVLLMAFFSMGRRDVDGKKLRAELADFAEVLHEIDGYNTEGHREHFGFRDGISQPYLAGSNTTRQGRDGGEEPIQPGEFVLGYLNEAGVLPTSPHIDATLDRANRLRPLPRNRARRDFGRNGSYLVLRQLEQHVDEFNRFLGGFKAKEQEWIAAKMVGRWRSGAPLVKAPDADRASLQDDNDFSYHDADPLGHACPPGAHIRRANPRDSLVDEAHGITRELAAQRSRRHRLIRRARLYQTGSERGLLFLCLNANLEDQFEFVQHNWLNNTHFAGLEDEPDPLNSVRPAGGRSMTIPTRTGRRKLAGLSDFVTVRGGGYFFLPGLDALRVLADL